MNKSKTFVNKMSSKKVTAYLVEDEVTPIETKWGTAYINPGVWLVTDDKGEQYGVTQADMEHFYELLGDTPEN